MCTVFHDIAFIKLWAGQVTLLFPQTCASSKKNNQCDVKTQPQKLHLSDESNEHNLWLQITQIWKYILHSLLLNIVQIVQKIKHNPLK